jgi:hypothetical protein
LPPAGATVPPWFRLLFGGQADAGIRDAKLDPIAPVRHLAHAQRDLAFFSELAGIAQQVEQNLLEPHGVRGERAQVLFRFDNEAVLVFFGKLSRGADDLIDKLGQTHWLKVELWGSLNHSESGGTDPSARRGTPGATLDGGRYSTSGVLRCRQQRLL